MEKREKERDMEMERGRATEKKTQAKIIYRFASYSTMDCRAKRIFHMKDTLHDTKRTLAPNLLMR